MLIEQVFSVIAEGTRREILDALAQEPKAVGQLVDELSVSQPTVSKHLRVLREAGVVTMRAQGQKRFYSINTEPLVLVSEWLDGLGAGMSKATAAPARAATAKTESRPATTATGAAIATTTTTSAAAQQTSAQQSSGQQTRTPHAPLGASAPTVAQGAAVARTQVPAESENSVPGQITRSVGRAANKAADLLANLPTFRRKRY